MNGRRSNAEWLGGGVGASLALGLVLLLLLLTGGLACNGKRVRPPSKGSFYQLRLTRPYGQMLEFRSLRGQVVLVDFFASYCSPCLYLIPKLKKLHKRYKKKNFTVLGVALERQVKEILIPYLNFLQINYPVVVADRSVYQGKTFFRRITQIPRSYLIDRCGRLRKIYQGVVPLKAIEADLKKILAEKSSCSKGS